MKHFVQSVSDQEIIDLCSRMIRVQSVNPPGEELKMAEFCAEYLKEAGFQVKLVPHDAERASLLAVLKGSGELPPLLWSAHIDTVSAGENPWLRDPFSGEVSDGKIWGRGSSDMKSGLAAMMAAGKTLARNKIPLRGDLILGLTAGEEVNCMGAEVLAELPELQHIQAILVSEPSNNDLYIAEKGSLWLEIVTFGKTAHGSMPHLGVNALTMMMRFLDGFEKLSIPFTPHPLLGEFTRSVNTIVGGKQTNVVPDRCAVTIDMRTIPGQVHESIQGQIQSLIDDLTGRIPGFRAEIHALSNHVSVTTDPQSPVVKTMLGSIKTVTGEAPQPKGVRYVTDAAVYVPRLNAPMVICGPGIPEMCHQPDEYVMVEKLLQSEKIYIQAGLDFLVGE